MSAKRHSPQFRPGSTPGHADGRLTNGTFSRNHEPVCAALIARLGDLCGHALEIGSGTGQHVQGFARALPQLQWQPSDPDPIHRASIDAWSVAMASGLAPAMALDARDNFAGALAHLLPLQLMFSMNVIHIAPWSVAQSMIDVAGRCLAPGGWLGFYGPFQERGRHMGEGNATFDAGLRADNPDWGLRDIDDLAALAAQAGLGAPQRDIMPANNLILWFQRTSPTLRPSP